MSSRHYTWLWFVLTALLVVDNYLLNTTPKESFTHAIVHSVSPQWLAAQNNNLSPEPGRPISLFLGWSGIGFMLLTNLYIARKRIKWLRFGKLPGWLDFHIFCGMLGPTLIVFHSNFKVRGLVAISFWSMVIVAVSGIVGRYFYLQVSKKQSDLEDLARNYETKFISQASQPPFQVPVEKLELAKRNVLQVAGGAALALTPNEPSGVFHALLSSLTGNLKLAFRFNSAAMEVPNRLRPLLRAYAITRRQAYNHSAFQELLGYWHSFHMPFAFAMYVVAVIHIVSASLFGVRT